MTKTKVDGMETASNAIQTGHAGVLLQTLVRALAAVMEGEASALCGAGYGERSEERSNVRNGYRDRVLETRMGTVDLKIPKLREGSYLPSFLEPRRRWEQAFVSVVSEAYVRGVSTRKVDELVKAMGAQGMSKSEVSRLCATLDEDVKAFRERKLDRAYPHRR
jgi:putative transposase